MSEKPVCPFCQRPVKLDGDTLRCEYENCSSRYCGLCNELWDLHPRIGCSARLEELSLATNELEKLLDTWEYALTTGRWQKCANCGEPHSRHDHDACPFKTEIAAAREAIEKYVARMASKEVEP